MPKTLDLTGRWAGYYTQHDERRSISAELVQDGEELSGSMSDECTHFEISIPDLVMQEGLPPGADEQIVERIRSAHPEAGDAPIRAESDLPSDSVVRGEVDGKVVQFLKTYQGDHLAGLRIGESWVGAKITGHQVFYRGQVSTDGSEIEGRWRVSAAASGPLQGARIEGGFLLKRSDR